MPFGGKYRIIDFALSNTVNSGLTDVGILTAKKALAVHTLANGTYTLEITATGKTAYYVGVMLPCGLIVVSRVMATADYGA